MTERHPRPSPSRRVVLGTALGGAAALAVPEVAKASSPAAGHAPTWHLRWAPDAARDGLGAFETVEDDRANSHPAGRPHIFVQGGDYRFNIHTVDRDISPDRQRQEVTGMRNPAGGPYLQWHLGETWRVTYQMYIPSTLEATTTFTHIMQMKEPGQGSAPIVVQSLRRVGGRQTIELRVFASDTLVGSTDLVPLQNTWIDVDFQIKIGTGRAGAVRWTLSTAGSTIVDAAKSGVSTFLADRVRPKWGIYRSLGDTSGSIQNTYMLLTAMRGYQLV